MSRAISRALLLCTLFAAPVAEAGERRALLIGIDDYSASRLPEVAPVEDRGWPSLNGAVNDVTTFADLLDARGFAVVTLTDQEATRNAILQELERLAHTARKEDVLFVYFAGHGSQVANSRSDEPDKLDESLVPADSKRGAADIRDKELRRIFNRILDRGARLTVMIDACHSGSGARGRTRSIRRDDRDVLDRTPAGPRPENRGALVLAATQDYDRAGEVADGEGNMRGAFTWAWLRAMRDASPHEPAVATFQRAQARLRAETPFQEPVMAGDAAARNRPFLGFAGAAKGAEHSGIAVGKIQRDGTLILQGGWANGLSPGAELSAGRTRVIVTELLGPGRSKARVAAGEAVRSGALLETPRRRWYEVQSPPSPYRLVVRHRGTVVGEGGVLTAGKSYELAVSGDPALPPRYLYVFVVDSAGRSTLLFPESGSVENRFPLSTLGAFTVQPPYGRDTFYLLATDEALPNPWILEWDGVRAPLQPAWSLHKTTFESRGRLTSRRQ
ncbi:MAG TPA: caspase family protein [Thermoanaerobaculia bacterium]